MKKKSQGHVEMIISFLLFITFIVLFLIFLNPFQKKPDSTQVFDLLEKGILKEISVKVGILSIVVNDTNSCYELNFKDYNINPLAHYIEVKDDDRKYSIYFSSSFERDHSTKKSCEPKNYKTGLYFEEEMISYEKALEFKDIDYNNFKKSLGINNDFSISYKNSDGTELTELKFEKYQPKGIEVIAKEFPLRMINKEGKINEILMNIRAF
jgi:hypothetical protein